MKRKQYSDPLPMDIITEILSKSSAKSVARFGLASKYCAAIVSRADFTELFLTRSLTRPRIFFAVKNHRRWSFFSSPQPHNPGKKPTLVLEADFLKRCEQTTCPEIRGPVSSLVLLPHNVSDICNLSTGQYARLPPLTRKCITRSLLGYDPIGKQYKVLKISRSFRESFSKDEHILTLSPTGKMSWRKIWLLNHDPQSEGICINGVLYYVAIVTEGENSVKKIACFNVRHEKLEFLNAYPITQNVFSSYTKLINYKGKVGVISWYWYGSNRRPRSALKLDLWVLEDTQKQEWLKRSYVFPVNVVIEGDVSVVGVTAASGEIVFSMDYTSKPFFVFYFNPERNTFVRVGIQGFEESENPARVYTFVDYAEDFKFI